MSRHRVLHIYIYVEVYGLGNRIHEMHLLTLGTRAQLNGVIISLLTTAESVGIHAKSGNIGYLVQIPRNQLRHELKKY